MHLTMNLLIFVVAIFSIIHATPLQDFTKGNRLFTSDIYKEYKKNETGNFLLSPFSAEVVLALTQSGAKDATAQELRTSLHLPNNDQTIRSQIRSYFKSLQEDGSNCQLHSANKIYVKENVAIKDAFKKVATGDFHADIENIDFGQTAEAANTINRWVEQKTKNKIHNLIDPQSLGDDVAAVLVNALYFQGRWSIQFSKAATKVAQFYRTQNDVVNIDTMFKKEKYYPYFESAELDAKFLELPFDDCDASLVVVLPNQKEGLATLEGKAKQVFEKQDFGHELVDVALPKFKIESKIDFKTILEKLGVSKLFSKEADLSGIAGGKGDLSVAEVIQKAFVDVNEEGVEAAAATAVLPVLGSALIKDPPKQFVVDHPFIFYIKANNVVLFAGRVLDPTK